MVRYFRYHVVRKVTEKKDGVEEKEFKDSTSVQIVPLASLDRISGLRDPGSLSHGIP